MPCIRTLSKVLVLTDKWDWSIHFLRTFKASIFESTSTVHGWKIYYIKMSQLSVAEEGWSVAEEGWSVAEGLSVAEELSVAEGWRKF
jgi:hypothetical protein